MKLDLLLHPENIEFLPKSYSFFCVQFKSYLFFPTALVIMTSLPDLSHYYLSVMIVTMFFWTRTLIKGFSNLGT